MENSKPVGMKVEDLPEGINPCVGMRIRSLTKDRHGTIVRVVEYDDDYAWILWDGEFNVYSGFYWKDCECIVTGWDGISTIE